ncbi:hypothetical protein KKJ09_21695 [Xenorhabdus bovienii]|uniref:hypothetical protein n=1 Tax=Xenorhabdus bovienii TaxID=40576 RepID=UPI0023B32CA2|nr:hypothetical protein [Xenorhabdus bovienii]MDE9496099.1 hypothetical protein [Xenorhabdus bovienii]MDE9504500.1 hypothetical protein [Xenorhabdus bovienii]MDE9528109.1 hypothetical protein [Xenorhabdus bovienii]MDE9571128.1 hypothetical protein [Xenorhabdus bovienii]
MSKTTDQLVRIASAGGGIIIRASEKNTDQFVIIATAMANSPYEIKPTLTLLGAGYEKNTDQLVRIAEAGKGCVVFEI